MRPQRLRRMRQRRWWRPPPQRRRRLLHCCRWPARTSASGCRSSARRPGWPVPAAACQRETTPPSRLGRGCTPAWIGAGEAVAQQDLRHARAIGDCDRNRLWLRWRPSEGTASAALRVAFSVRQRTAKGCFVVGRHPAGGNQAVDLDQRSHDVSSQTAGALPAAGDWTACAPTAHNATAPGCAPQARRAETEVPNPRT